MDCEDDIFSTIFMASLSLSLVGVLDDYLMATSAIKGKVHNCYSRMRLQWYEDEREVGKTQWELFNHSNVQVSQRKRQLRAPTGCKECL